MLFHYFLYLYLSFLFPLFILSAYLRIFYLKILSANTVLVHSNCFKKNTTDCLACKQQTFTPHSSGVWEDQDQVFLLRACFWFHRYPSSAVFLCSGRGKDSLWSLCFLTAQVPLMRTLLSRSNHLPKAPTPSSKTLGVRFQHRNFTRTGYNRQTFI